jgi:hypothetical protein
MFLNVLIIKEPDLLNYSQNLILIYGTIFSQICVSFIKLILKELNHLFYFKRKHLLDDQEGLRHDAYAVKIRCIHTKKIKNKKRRRRRRRRRRKKKEVCPSLLPCFNIHKFTQ